MNEEWRKFSYSEKQINNLAKKIAFKRLSHLGVDYKDAFDEVKQELSIAWVEAVNRYDPSKGASFSTFLHTGMLRHINRFIANNYETEPAAQINSLPASGTSTQNDESDFCIELSTDKNSSPLAIIERESCYDLVTRNLSDRAKQFVTFLRNPPIELVRALDDLVEKAKYARSKGQNYAAVRRVSANIIFKIMGARRSERDRIVKEIRNQAIFL